MKALIIKHKLCQNKKGFSMAEMMMAVAIIGVLAAVSFISVSSYMRSMKLLERNGIAKEIFVAAQNHLTYADSQDYPGVNEDDLNSFKIKNVYSISDDNNEIKSDNNEIKSYFICVTKGDEFSKNKILNLILPFGAIDETVRLGGDYIIHFTMEPARILNVFYSESNGSRYDINDLKNRATSLIGWAKPEKDNNNKEDPLSPGAVIGYFGEDDAGTLESVKVLPPKVKVDNGDRLKVVITDPNEENVSIRLVVEGLQSGNVNKDIYIKMKDVEIDEEIDEEGYTYIMDDITKQGKHFYELFGQGKEPLLPGEDIKISAEALSADKLSNIAKSAEYITNSLYARVIDPDNKADSFDYNNQALDDDNYGSGYPAVNGKKIIISSFRHLENLDQDISNVDKALFPNTESACAFQTKDLEWDKFSEEVGKKIFNLKNSFTNDGFYPVSPIDNMSYNGAYSYKTYENGNGEEKPELHREYHKITGIVVNASAGYAGGENGAGLFGKLSGNEYFIKNIELVDFKINSERNNVGALVGTAQNAVFDNVVVYNSNASKNTGNTACTVTTSSGSAGGLIGEMKGGKIARCGAALTVIGSENAGGLVGKVDGSERPIKIMDCYAGGQTTNGGVYDEMSPNVKIVSEAGVAGVAGGLVGLASGSVEIGNSYSTCSVEAKVAGGFIGTGSGLFTSCYSTGLVNAGKLEEGKVSGAFAASPEQEGTSYRGCFYLETINGGFNESQNDYVYLDPLGRKGQNLPKVNGLEPYDSDEMDDYSFVAATSGSGGGTISTPQSESQEKEQITVPYDQDLISASALSVIDNDKYKDYPLMRYGSMLGKDSDNVKTYVKIHYGDWPTPEILVINTPSD